MRFALALAAFLLVFGCASQAPPAAGGPNATSPAEPPNVTAPPSNTSPPEPVVSGNISEIPAPAANQSGGEPPNGTDVTDVTFPQNATPEPPEPEEFPGMRFGGRYLLVLDDASVVPTSKEPCGIFSIRLASDNSVLDKTIICPGESYVWRDESGHAFRIFVVKVAAGYSGTGSWVDVRIYG